MVSRFHGVDSEVGALRTVIVHRPGAELKRVIPRHAGRLVFAGLPWAARAQQEHDSFTQALRDRGVQVLYLTELLQDVLEYAPARQQAISAALGAEPLEGGDVLLAAPGVIATGTSPPAASNGTTRATCSCSVLGSSCPTNATWPPTPGWNDAASR
jgi:Arginine deiminase